MAPLITTAQPPRMSSTVCVRAECVQEGRVSGRDAGNGGHHTLSNKSPRRRPRGLCGGRTHLLRLPVGRVAGLLPEVDFRRAVVVCGGVQVSAQIVERARKERSIHRRRSTWFARLRPSRGDPRAHWARARRSEAQSPPARNRPCHAPAAKPRDCVCWNAERPARWVRRCTSCVLRSTPAILTEGGAEGH